MKVIISHDVDHITVWEHYKDLIILKHLVRNHLELFKGKISIKEYFLRWSKIFTNKWQNVVEVMDFNDSRGIKSNFFMGVNNGVGLSYSLKHVKKMVPLIKERGFELGVHGINYENFSEIKEEFNTFKNIYGNENFGMRMHYLRQNETTFTNIAKSGYLFDSTKHGYENPYLIGNMWEFPLQIMDGWVMYQDKSEQALNFEQAKQFTIKQINKAKELNLKYLNILFHDCYFDNCYMTWKKWYCWVIDYLIEQKFEFVTYSEAINELNNNNKNEANS